MATPDTAATEPTAWFRLARFRKYALVAGYGIGTGLAAPLLAAPGSNTSWLLLLSAIVVAQRYAESALLALGSRLEAAAHGASAGASASAAAPLLALLVLLVDVSGNTCLWLLSVIVNAWVAALVGDGASGDWLTPFQLLLVLLLLIAGVGVLTADAATGADSGAAEMTSAVLGYSVGTGIGGLAADSMEAGVGLALPLVVLLLLAHRARVAMRLALQQRAGRSTTALLAAAGGRSLADWGHSMVLWALSTMTWRAAGGWFTSGVDAPRLTALLTVALVGTLLIWRAPAAVVHNATFIAGYAIAAALTAPLLATAAASGADLLSLFLLVGLLLAGQEVLAAALEAKSGASVIVLLDMAGNLLLWLSMNLTRVWVTAAFAAPAALDLRLKIVHVAVIVPIVALLVALRLPASTPSPPP